MACGSDTPVYPAVRVREASSLSEYPFQQGSSLNSAGIIYNSLHAIQVAGTLFSLGHGVVVLLVAIVAGTHSAGWQTTGWLEVSGASDSVFFLYGLAFVCVRRYGPCRIRRDGVPPDVDRF